MNLKERIIVLKTYKHSESDLVIHGLNSTGARIGFFAKGALKSRKRFAGGVLEPTHYIEATYKQRQSPDGDPLHTLLEATLLREFSKLRTDYSRLEMALNLLQVVHKLGQHGVIDDPALFNLLGNALQAAETSGELEKLKLQFELKLLAGQGILPTSDAFAPWLKAPLSEHESLELTQSNRHWLITQAHSHLQHYLGR